MVLMLLIVIHLRSRTLASVAMINISRAWKQGELHVPFSLGNGSRILFWHHPVGSSVLKDRFPGLFQYLHYQMGLFLFFGSNLFSLVCFFPQRLLKVEEIQILKLFLKFFRQLTLEVVLILGNGNWRPLGPSRLYEI